MAWRSDQSGPRRTAPRPERQVAFRFGLSAESRAATLLVVKGFRIMARRWKTSVGEVDIVARRKQLLVFVEVKARERIDDAAECFTTRASSAGSQQPQRRGLPTIRATLHAISV